MISPSAPCYKIPLAWGNADMSADDETTPIVRPDGATRALVFLSWTAPAGQEPVGTITFKGLETTTSSDSFTIPSSHASPAGSAVSQAIELYVYSAPVLQVAYTRSSGGVGAVCTASVTWS